MDDRCEAVNPVNITSSSNGTGEERSDNPEYIQM